MTEITYRVADSASAPGVDVVDAGLDSFNKQAALLDTVEPLVCVAELVNGDVIGGAIGRTWGNCCELQQLWVAEHFRHQGIGTQLLNRFEEQAKLRGCRTLYLETFSFQSPEFYRLRGYEVRLEIVGFPERVSKYFMVKERLEHTTCISYSDSSRGTSST